MSGSKQLAGHVDHNDDALTVFTMMMMMKVEVVMIVVMMMMMMTTLSVAGLKMMIMKIMVGAVMMMMIVQGSTFPGADGPRFCCGPQNNQKSCF